MVTFTINHIIKNIWMEGTQTYPSFLSSGLAMIIK